MSPSTGTSEPARGCVFLLAVGLFLLFAVNVEAASDSDSALANDLKVATLKTHSGARTYASR